MPSYFFGYFQQSSNALSVVSRPVRGYLTTSLPVKGCNIPMLGTYGPRAGSNVFVPHLLRQWYRCSDLIRRTAPISSPILKTSKGYWWPVLTLIPQRDRPIRVLMRRWAYAAKAYSHLKPILSFKTHVLEHGNSDMWIHPKVPLTLYTPHKRQPTGNEYLL